MGPRPGHAALLHDREQDVEVAQPYPAADPAIPVQGFSDY